MVFSFGSALIEISYRGISLNLFDPHTRVGGSDSAGFWDGCSSPCSAQIQFGPCCLSVSLPEFMDFKVSGKTVLVATEKLRVFGQSTQEGEVFAQAVSSCLARKFVARWSHGRAERPPEARSA